ncbi:MAG: RNA polymerase sigma factor [Pseudomonadota bacterium]
MESSEEALVLAAADGDRAAFVALAARVYDRLFALAFRLTGARAEAEDLTQDVLVALPRKLAGFRAEARFSTWLYRVAVNAAHDRRRRDVTRARANAGWGEVEVARRAEAAEDRTRQDWLAGAMAALPEELRDTVALLTDGEMTQAEAAEVLGVSPGTVAWRISEVKKRLADLARQEETL